MKIWFYGWFYQIITILVTIILIAGIGTAIYVVGIEAFLRWLSIVGVSVIIGGIVLCVSVFFVDLIFDKSGVSDKLIGFSKDRLALVEQKKTLKESVQTGSYSIE